MSVSAKYKTLSKEYICRKSNYFIRKNVIVQMGSIAIQMKTKQYMGNFIHIKLKSIQYNWQILNIATCHLHLNNKRRGLNFSETNTLQTIGKYMYMALCAFSL